MGWDVSLTTNHSVLVLILDHDLDQGICNVIFTSGDGRGQ